MSDGRKDCACRVLLSSGGPQIWQYPYFVVIAKDAEKTNTGCFQEGKWEKLRALVGGSWFPVRLPTLSISYFTWILLVRKWKRCLSLP